MPSTCSPKTHNSVVEHMFGMTEASRFNPWPAPPKGSQMEGNVKNCISRSPEGLLPVCIEKTDRNRPVTSFGIRQQPRMFPWLGSVFSVGRCQSHCWHGHFLGRQNKPNPERAAHFHKGAENIRSSFHVVRVDSIGFLVRNPQFSHRVKRLEIFYLF